MSLIVFLLESCFVGKVLFIKAYREVFVNISVRKLRVSGRVKSALKYKKHPDLVGMFLL